jgi:hypothetical protein
MLLPNGLSHLVNRKNRYSADHATVGQNTALVNILRVLWEDDQTVMPSLSFACVDERMVSQVGDWVYDAPLSHKPSANEFSPQNAQLRKLCTATRDAFAMRSLCGRGKFTIWWYTVL